MTTNIPTTTDPAVNQTSVWSVPPVDPDEVSVDPKPTMIQPAVTSSGIPTGGGSVGNDTPYGRGASHATPTRPVRNQDDGWWKLPLTVVIVIGLLAVGLVFLFRSLDGPGPADGATTTTAMSTTDTTAGQAGTATADTITTTTVKVTGTGATTSRRTTRTTTARATGTTGTTNVPDAQPSATPPAGAVPVVVSAPPATTMPVHTTLAGQVPTVPTNRAQSQSTPTTVEDSDMEIPPPTAPSTTQAPPAPPAT